MASVGSGGAPCRPAASRHHCSPVCLRRVALYRPFVHRTTAPNFIKFAARRHDLVPPVRVDVSEAPVTVADELVREAHELAETGIVPEGFRESYPARLEAELKRLAGAEAAAESMAAALRDQHLRLAADYDNFRKRSAAEKDALRAGTRAAAVGELLGVADSFEQAGTSMRELAQGSEEARRTVDAYDAVYRQLLAAFKRLGVEPVPAVGEQFDPEIHEAIMREPAAPGVEDGTVIHEFRRGFSLGSQLLRAAMVKVAFVDEPADGDQA